LNRCHEPDGAFALRPASTPPREVAPIEPLRELIPLSRCVIALPRVIALPCCIELSRLTGALP
jgi:hypothetical protein